MASTSCRFEKRRPGASCANTDLGKSEDSGWVCEAMSPSGTFVTNTRKSEGTGDNSRCDRNT